MVFFNFDGKSKKEDDGLLNVRLTDGDNSVRVEEVYLLKTTILANYSNGEFHEPQNVTWYFLGRECNGEYYELFGGEKVEKRESCLRNGADVLAFNTPYIIEAKPLSEYIVGDCPKEGIPYQKLVRFVTNKNVEAHLDDILKKFEVSN